MKLPRPVQGSVPQQMVENPNELQQTMMVADATRQLVNTLGNAAIGYSVAMENNKLNQALGSSLNEYEKLSAYLENAKAIDIANDEYVPVELRQEIESSIDGGVGENKFGQKYLPAYMVREKIHDYHAKKIQQTAHGFLGGKKNLIRRFDSALASRMSKGAASIVELNVKEQVADMAAAGDVYYEEAVKAQNGVQAQEVIQSMAESGLWDSNKVAEHLNKYEGDIQFYGAMQDIVGGDALTVEATVNTLDDPENRMSPEQKWTIKQRADSILDAKTKERKEQVKRNSEVVLGDSLFELGSAGLSWADIESRKGKMEPNDYQTLVNAKRAEANRGSTPKDNPAVLNRLSILVGRLSIPDPEIPIANRKAEVINALHEALGYDPLTGKYNGIATITSATYFKLLAQVNQAEERLISDPRTEIEIEKAYRMLTGASRSMAAQILGDKSHVKAAAEFEADLLTAALEAGPGFDATLWSTENLPFYLDRAEKGQGAVDDNAAVKNLMIKKEGAEGKLINDYAATRELIKARLRAGQFNAEQVKAYGDILDIMEKAEGAQ